MLFSPSYTIKISTGWSWSNIVKNNKNQPPVSVTFYRAQICLFHGVTVGMCNVRAANVNDGTLGWVKKKLISNFDKIYVSG